MVEKRGAVKPEVVNKLILKKAVEHRVRQISEKAYISEKEVYDLVRSFFKKYINLNYEFTSEELLTELRKIYLPPELQDGVKSILVRVSEIEHLSRNFSRDELKAVLDDFSKLVNALISSHYEKKSFGSWLKDHFHKSVSNDHKGVFDGSALVHDEQVIVRMNVLMDNARRLASRDVAAAKNAYLELMSLYNGLDDEKKSYYYKPVSELYALLRNKSF